MPSMNTLGGDEAPVLAQRHAPRQQLRWRQLSPRGSLQAANSKKKRHAEELILAKVSTRDDRARENARKERERERDRAPFLCGMMLMTTRTHWHSKETGKSLCDSRDRANRFFSLQQDQKRCLFHRR